MSRLPKPPRNNADPNGFALDGSLPGARVYHLGAAATGPGVSVTSKAGKAAAQALHPVVVLVCVREGNRRVLQLRPAQSCGPAVRRRKGQPARPADFSAPWKEVVADPRLHPGVPLAAEPWAEHLDALAARPRVPSAAS